MPAPASAAPPAAVTAAPANSRGYPASRRAEVVDRLHGVELRDPYRWLEDEKSPEVQAWMKAQDDFARGILKGLPKRAELAQRFRELFDIEHIGVPFKRGKRYFWARKEVGKDKHAVLVRDGKRGEPRVLLDPNTWSTDASVSLGSYGISWNGKYVAYQVKRNNSDEAILEILDIDTGKKLPEVIDGAKYTWRVAWNEKGSGFYYTKVPPVGGAVTVADRPGYAEIRYHELGSDPARDPVVHEATRDPTTFHYGDLSRDGRYLIASVRHGWISSDVYFQDLHEKPKPVWKPLIAGQPHIYAVEVHRGRFYVVTNEGAPNWRIFRVDPAKPERASWTEIVPERKDTIIDALSIVGGRLGLVTIKDVALRLEVRALDGKLAYDVALPEPGSVSELIGNEDDDEAHYQFESFGRPPEVHAISIRSGKSELRTTTRVPVDATRVLTEQRFATSKDGTRVPYFVIRDKNRQLDGSAPLLLNGYGGFSQSLTPSFAASAFPWIEQGGVYVVANLRGGSEYGERWHEAGMRHNKQNVFDDYIAVAEDLIAQRYTRADRLVLRGRSNGGLLVGTALTQRPELFRAVICGVPLLDMLRYHLFGSGKTWISEYGSADDAAEFRTLYAYSPYQHVKDGVRYPSLLLSSADSDDRVDPMHARKFAAALQHSSAGGPVLLRIQHNAGHGGADKIQELVDERADEYAFALSEVAR
ncbi:MAG TPA: prolyl oligopeptidase family serine peptidase [Polyangiaceae bacterium]